MTESTDQPLVVEIGRTYSDGRSDVFLKRNGGPLFSDKVSLVSETSRRRFLQKCQVKIPGLGDDECADLDAKLIQHASDASTRAVEVQPDAPKSLDELVRERDDAADAALGTMPPDVVREAELMLDDPALIDCIQRDLGAIGIAGEADLRLTIYLVLSSRLLSDPQSAVVQGPSGSGKSHTINQVGSLAPPEGVFNTTDLTPNALYYTREGELVHVFVAAGEKARRKDDEQAEATRAMREMISAKVLRKTVPVRSESGEMVTRTVERFGPIAFIESTTQTELFAEDANRVLALVTDESEEQTRRVLEYRAKRAAGQIADDPTVIPRHHALQRLLRRVCVRVPFAQAIVGKMPAGRPEARRAAGHLLSIIQTIALLHQRQRRPADAPLEHGTVIDATLDDYALARRLLAPILGRMLGDDLTPAIANFGRRVVAGFRGVRFTAADAAQKDTSIKDAEVARRYLNKLVRPGVVRIAEPGGGGKPNIYEVVGEVPEPGETWLPAPESVERPNSESAGTPTAPPAGCQVRQVGEDSEPADLMANAIDGWPPALPVPLGASGCLSPPAEVEPTDGAGCRTSPTEPHHRVWLPESVVDQRLAAQNGRGRAGNRPHRLSDDLDPGDICCVASRWRPTP